MKPLIRKDDEGLAALAIMLFVALILFALTFSVINRQPKQIQKMQQEIDFLMSHLNEEALVRRLEKVLE